MLGTDPAAWSLEAVAAPLVAGWVGLAILASATHLLPAVGPGDPASRARQSSLLGRRPLLRLGLADVGVAALAAGLPFDMESLVVSGTVLLAVALAWTLGLLVGAIGVAVRAS